MTRISYLRLHLARGHARDAPAKRRSGDFAIPIPPARWNTVGMARLSAKAKQRLYSNLEKYARSGMGMGKALESLLGQPRLTSSERGIYQGMLDSLERGRSIGEALGDSSDAITPLESEVVSAAESGGRLERGFAHLAEYFRRSLVTRRRILKGLTYPLVLLHLAIPVSTLAVTATRQFAFDGNEAPGFTAAFIDTGKWVLLGYLVAILLVLWCLFLFRLARRSAGVDRGLNLVPLLGSARRWVAMERFTQVFEIFLLSGRKISDSLEGAGKASGSGQLRAAGAKGAKRIQEGETLSEALYSSASAYPADFLKGMTVAEESGQLDRELEEWSRFYSESAREAMEQVAEWTPKLFYWAVLVFVAFLVIRAALSYRDLLMRLVEGDL